VDSSEYSVKLWYISGAFEQIDHIDRGCAETILAEARGSSRVEAGEIHDCRGMMTDWFFPAC
jgi:hypothetical protein